MGKNRLYNTLDGVFDRLEMTGRKALIAYLSAGYPSLKNQAILIEAMKEEGVDILELGVPFSDPIADGPTIQMASQKSLDRGITLAKILKWIHGVFENTGIPIVIMSYLNPIMSYGMTSFARDARQAGVAGVIVPDLIPEEAGELSLALRKEDIHHIQLVAPTTPFKRQKFIAVRSGGFLYAVSVTGVTGARKTLPLETKSWLQKLRKVSPVPVCVGFGISEPRHIRALKGAADGFIIGSALINRIDEKNSKKTISQITRFLRELSKECQNGRGQ